MSASTERAIVGALLASWPDELPPVVAKVLRFAPDSFDDRKLGAIAAGMRALYAKGTPPSPLTMSQASKWSALELEALTVENVGNGILEHEAREQWSSFRARRILSIHAEAAEMIREKPEQAGDISARATAAVASLDDDERDEVFNGRGGMRYCDLISTVKTALSVTPRTAERLIADWTQYRLIEKAVAELYVPKD